MTKVNTKKTNSVNNEDTVMTNDIYTNTTNTKAIKTPLVSDKYDANAEDSVDSIKVYLNEVGRISLLCKEDEMALGERILNGDKDAVGELVKRNLRLAVSVAKSYAALYRVDISDLIQAANYGLILAANKFDYRVAKFSTIAVRYCKAYISKHLRKFNTPLYVSEHDTELLSRIRSIRQVYVVENEKEPTVEDIVNAYNATTKNAKKHIDCSKAAALLGVIYTTSLDDRIDDDGCKVEELVADKTVDTFGDIVDADIHMLWYKAISALETRKALIVRLYTGFDCDRYSFNDIGKMLQISGERVRQLFDEACEEIANGPYSKALRDYSA